MIERPYQLEAMHGNSEFPGIFGAWDQGFKRPLVVMPTGCGKTVVFAWTIQRIFPKRTLVVAHRQELIYQASDTIQGVTGLSTDIEMGERRAGVGHDMFGKRKSSVVVSTIQTLTSGGDGGGRIGKFDPMEFGLVVIDESHHAPTDSYEKVINYMSTNPDIKFLGVTATPKRGDERAMGRIFDVVAYNYEMAEAIEDGWLVPIDQQYVSIESLDFSKVRTVAGDLHNADVAAVMEAEKPLYGVAYSTIEMAGDKRGIGFAASVHHASMLANIMNRHRPGMAGFVSAKTDKLERARIIKDFKAGNVQFLWNCGIFTEGFDDAGIDVISMGRPTKSLGLYIQMMGRGTRPHPGISHDLNNIVIPAARRGMIARSRKPSCLIIDHVGNSGKHKLVSSADVLCGDYSYEAKEKAVQFAMKFGKPVRMYRQAQKEEDELKKEAEIKARREQEEARKAKLIVTATYKSKKIDPFDILQVKPADPHQKDAGKDLTERMRNFLLREGFVPEEFNYSRAKQLIGLISDRREKKLCTLNQAKWLKKFKVRTDITIDQASACLDAIAKNRWRGLPQGFVIPAPKQRDIENEPF